MQCSLLVRTEICKLFKVPAIARRLFAKETVGSLTNAGRQNVLGVVSLAEGAADAMLSASEGRNL